MSRSQWTKQLVDNHVQSSLKNVKDEKERKLRSFQFAKMYFDVKEYEHARRYLVAFMSVKDNMASAHKLLGQILEMQNKPAIDAYKRSYELDSQQNDVLLKLCELYSQSSSLSPELAKYWADKAEKAFPSQDVVFRLKLKANEAMGNGNGDSHQDLLNLLILEADKFPWDVNRQVRLLRQYVNMGRIDDAYSRAIQIDFGSQSNFAASLDFHYCLCDIFRVYKDEIGSSANGFFHQHYLSALNNLTALTIEKASISDAVKALWSLDEALSVASKISCHRDDWKVFCREMEAQYFFHCGTVILNKAVKERLEWREACTVASACFAASFSVPQPSNRSAWYAKAKDEERKVYNEWLKAASYRCSQTGHMLLNLGPSIGCREWLEKIPQDYCLQQGNEKLFELLFAHEKENDAGSYLINSNLFTTFTPRFPVIEDLRELDQDVQQLRPGSLHHAVWICLQYYSTEFEAQPNYGLKLFDGLSYETTNLKVAGPESLRQLDVEAFLYAVVRVAALRQTDRRRVLDDGRPVLLPASICELLCTAEQQNWWSAVHRLVTNTARDSLGQSRAILQRGLETIRVVNNSGLDIDLTVHLARTFAFQAGEKQLNVTTANDMQTEIEFLQLRAVHYWRAAVEKLEKHQKKQIMRLPKLSLFENHDDQLSDADAQAYLNDGRLYIAKHLTDSSKFNEALELLNLVPTPEASFQTALVYKACALNEASRQSSDSTSTERRNAILSRAKDALCLTLDRIRGNRMHLLNACVAEEMDIIESHLAQINDTSFCGADVSRDLGLSFSNTQLMATPSRSVCSAIHASNSDRDVRVAADADAGFTQSTPRVIKPQLMSNGTSTSPLPSSSGGNRCRPTPDRLDAELRSLRFMQDNIMKTVTDDIKSLRTLLEHIHATTQHTAERMTGMESKVAVIMEFQRQQMLMVARPPPVVPPAGPLPSRGPAIVSSVSGASLHADNMAAYPEYQPAVPVYDPTVYMAPQMHRPVLPAPQQGFSAPQLGFPTYPPPPTHQGGFVLPNAGAVDHRTNHADEYDYGTDQYEYTEDDYGENALSYEIHNPLVPLASHEIFMSGGDTARTTGSQPGPILPGFFTNSVKQSLANSSSSSLTNITPVSKPASSEGPKSSFQAAVDLCTAKPSSTELRPVVKDSVTSSASSTDDEAGSGISSSVPISNKTATSQPKLILNAPKFIASPPAVATTASQPAFTAAKTEPKAAVADDTKPKTIFGGISFTSTPVVASSTATKDVKKEVKKEEADKDVKPANPFANFSFNLQPKSEQNETDSGAAKPVFAAFTGFTSPNKTTQAASTSVDTKTTSTPAANLPVFGTASSSTQGLSFASVAAKGSPQGQTSAFGKKVDDAAVFQSAGQPVFKSTSVKSPSVKSTPGDVSQDKTTTHDEDDEATGEDYVPNAEFKPLVSLPEVEVKTGEESEQKLFGERAKLYRMDVESKQWKERGIGEMKILFNPETDRYRFVMRREQVLKLCANHYITASMALKPLHSSETSVCWFANDYAEGEMQQEQLCIKFKTVEQLKKFTACFEDCVAKTGQQTKEDKSKESSVTKPASAADSSDTPKPLSALFQSKPGEWQCQDCYVNNIPGTTSCVACNSPKPGSKSQTPALSVPATQPVIAVASDKPSLASQFQAKPGEWECTDCYVRNPSDKTSCLSCESPRPGAMPSSTSKPAATTTLDSGFKISATGGFSFGSVGSKPFSFGGAGFSSTPATTTPAAAAVTATSASQTTPAPSGGFIPKQTATFGGFKMPLATTSAGGTSTFSFGTAKSTQPSTVATTSASAAGSLFPSLTPTAPSSTSTPAKPGFPTFHASASTPVFAANKSTLPTFGSTSFTFQGIKPASSHSNLVAPSTTTPFKFAGFSATSTPAPAAAAEPASPSSPRSPDNDGGDNSAVEFEPDVSFEPVVRLPDDVEVKTGEEDEDVLYCHRAKLFRFADGEWKERGIGDVKILRHKRTDVVRIIMRRERVLKICMNHRLVPSLVLQPMLNSQGKAWTWHANDFADGEAKHEQFSIRFKTEEIANEFKKAFDDAVLGKKAVDVVPAAEQKPASGCSLLRDLLTAATAESSDDDCIVVEVKMPSNDLVKKATDLQLPPTFYNYLTAPACPGCIGCQSSEPEDKVSKSNVPAAATMSKPIFGLAKFVTPSTKSDQQPAAPLFGTKATTQSPAVFGTPSTQQKATSQPSAIFGSPAVFGPVAPKPAPVATQSAAVFGGGASFVSKPSTVFGGSAEQKPISSFGAIASSNPVFGSDANIVGFGDLSKSSTSGFGQKSGDASFSWAGSGAQLFTKQQTPKSEQKTTKNDDTVADGNESGGDDDENAADESQVDDIHFEPIVQLPECVDLKTGEEDEMEMYRQRGKLYRYDGGQWKERAVGEMKILKNKLTGNFRLLMRREQVHKVACNQLLTTEMSLQPMHTSETAWCWFGTDFAEDEPKVEQFAIRFKTIDLAKDFKEKFDECQSVLRNTAGDGQRGEDNTNNNSSGKTVAADDGQTVTVVASCDQQVPSATDDDKALFYKRATVVFKDTEKKVMVEVKIVPDCSSAAAARLLLLSDSGATELSHIISSEDLLTRPSTKACGLQLKMETGDEKCVDVMFSSTGAADEFEKVFKHWASNVALSS